MLVVQGLTKRFASTRSDEASVLAVNGVSFTVEPGEMFTLLGPSGCGKTTTLRSIAGLEHPDEGEITIDGRMVFSSDARIKVAAHKRHLGMVFQSYAIWPHMTVAENVAFPLKVLPQRERPSAAEIEARVARVLETVMLDHAANRKATKLSGGQQQRLALARGLVVEPPILLLDEPLSNLDLKLREEMRLELRRVQREVGVTAIYVTHDQGEALALSSRIAVMNAGSIEQLGTPEDVYRSPASLFVAGFIGSSNRLHGQVTELVGGLAHVQTSFGLLVGPAVNGIARGDRVTYFVRPEDVQLGSHRPSGDAPGVRGIVEDRAYLGEALEYVIRVGEEQIRVRSSVSQAFAGGDEIWLTFHPGPSQVLAGVEEAPA